MSNIYIESPNYLRYPEGSQVIFLAGDITGVEEWQSRAVTFLEDIPGLVICNPRRKHFEEFKAGVGFEDSRKQIMWGFVHLQNATQILFWFGKETVQPIQYTFGRFTGHFGSSALFELGTRIRDRHAMIFIGAHPNYSRRFDLVIQASLYGYNDPIPEKLEDVLQMVANYNTLLKQPDRPK